jgi:hypothetical protein
MRLSVCRLKRHNARKEKHMTRAHKLMGTAAALLLMFSVSTAPARAQFAGGGGADMMTQMAPMLNMIKAKMGKKRFGMLMQTVGPMASKMMDGGGFGGINGLGGFGGASFVGAGIPGTIGVPSVTPTGGNASGLVSTGFPTSVGGFGLNGFGGGDMMAMIPQLISLAGTGGHHHRHARPKG